MATVLVIGDTHCPGMRRGYVKFLQRTADRYGVNRVVHIGDLVDWASISYHEKSPSLSSAYREFVAAKKQVAKLSKAFPSADWMIGNHDSLTERQAITAGIPTEVLKDYADLWEVEWKAHPRFERLEIDGVLYSHGDCGRGGQDAAFKQSKDCFKSVVIGHFHSQAGVRWFANSEFRIFGMNVGCGVDASLLQFEYGRRLAARPVLGCGIVEHGKRAIFEPWLLKSR